MSNNPEEGKWFTLAPTPVNSTELIAPALSRACRPVAFFDLIQTKSPFRSSGATASTQTVSAPVAPSPFINRSFGVQPIRLRVSPGASELCFTRTHPQLSPHAPYAIVSSRSVPCTDPRGSNPSAPSAVDR